MVRMHTFARALVTAMIAAPALHAQLAFTGASLSQNFNTLPGTGTSFPISTLPTGWTSTQSEILVGSGTGNTGALYSFGGAGIGERALGSLASGGTGTISFGVWLVNNTSAAISSVTIGYTGEQWRRGDATANVLGFAYGLGATGLTTGTYTNVVALDFTAPITTGSNTALDGNLAANRTTRSATVSLNWGVGQSLWLRWQDVNDVGADDGVAIDDFTFAAGPTTVIPEPSTWALFATGLTVLVVISGRRRRGA
jgi:hypothetical protein